MKRVVYFLLLVFPIFSFAKNLMVNPSGNIIVSDSFTAKSEGIYGFPNVKEAEIVDFYVNGVNYKSNPSKSIGVGDRVRVKYVITSPLGGEGSSYREQNFLLKNSFDNTRFDICPNFIYKDGDLIIKIDGIEQKFKEKCIKGDILKGATRKFEIMVNKNLSKETITPHSSLEEKYTKSYDMYSIDKDYPIIKYVKGERGVWEIINIFNKSSQTVVNRIAFNASFLKDNIIKIKINKKILKDKFSKIKDLKVFVDGNYLEDYKLKEVKDYIEFTVVGREEDILLGELKDIIVEYEVSNSLISKEDGVYYDGIQLSIEGLNPESFIQNKYLSYVFPNKNLENIKEIYFLENGYSNYIKNNSYIIQKELDFSTNTGLINTGLDSVEDIRENKNYFLSPEGFWLKNWASLILSIILVWYFIFIFFYKDFKKIKYRRPSASKFNFDLHIEELRYLLNPSKFVPNVYNVFKSLNLKGYIKVFIKNGKVIIEKNESEFNLSKVESWFFKNLFKDKTELSFETSNITKVKKIFDFYVVDSKEYLKGYLDKNYISNKTIRASVISLLSLVVLMHFIWVIFVLDYLNFVEIISPLALLSLYSFVIFFNNFKLIKDNELLNEISIYKSFLNNKNIINNNNTKYLDNMSYKRLINYIIIFEDIGKSKYIIDRVVSRFRGNREGILFFNETNNKVIFNILKKI